MGILQSRPVSTLRNLETFKILLQERKIIECKDLVYRLVFLRSKPFTIAIMMNFFCPVKHCDLLVVVRSFTLSLVEYRTLQVSFLFEG